MDTPLKTTVQGLLTQLRGMAIRQMPGTEEFVRLESRCRRLEDTLTALATDEHRSEEAAKAQLISVIGELLDAFPLDFRVQELPPADESYLCQSVPAPPRDVL